MGEYKSARLLEESDSSESLFRPQEKRRKKRRSASGNSNSDSDCPRHTTVTEDSTRPSYQLEGSVTNGRYVQPNRKRRRRLHCASGNSRSDSDYRGHTSTITKKRKRRYQPEDSTSNNRYVKPNRRQRRRRNCTFKYSKRGAYYQGHTSTVTKQRRRRAYRTEDSDGNESFFEPERKRRKKRHNVFGKSRNEAGCPQHTSTVTKDRNIQTCRKEASQSFSDSDDSHSKLGRKSRLKYFSSSEYNSSDADCPAGAQQTDRIYHDVEPDEGRVAAHTSLKDSKNGRVCQYSAGGIFLETDEERASEDVSTSSRQPDATPKIEDGSSAAIPSTSSKSAAHTSDSRNDEQSACFICFAKFTTQDIGTTDTCNHSFCAACLEEWSTYVSTCPLDRQTFHFILVRHHLKGKIIKKIPVSSVRKELSFCGVCGECERQSRLLLCEGCSFACHVTCVDPHIDSQDYREWVCPYCYTLNETILIKEVIG